MNAFVAVVSILIMVVALFLIPLGLPGLWIMFGVLAIAAILGAVGIGTIVVLGAVAVAAEIAEFFLVKRMNLRYGGSRAAFWAALAGGLIGVVIGLPVPVIGSLLAGLAGTFAGALLVTWWETRHLGTAGRVGWGVLLGRVFASIVKVIAGVILLAVGAGALLFG